METIFSAFWADRDIQPTSQRNRAKTTTKTNQPTTQSHVSAQKLELERQGKKCLSESKSETAIISRCKDSVDQKKIRMLLKLEGL